MENTFRYCAFRLLVFIPADHRRFAPDDHADASRRMQWKSEQKEAYARERPRRANGARIHPGFGESLPPPEPFRRRGRA
jgi:hypothetical protein